MSKIFYNAMKENLFKGYEDYVSDCIFQSWMNLNENEFMFTSKDYDEYFSNSYVEKFKENVLDNISEFEPKQMYQYLNYLLKLSIDHKPEKRWQIIQENFIKEQNYFNIIDGEEPVVAGSIEKKIFTEVQPFYYNGYPKLVGIVNEINNDYRKGLLTSAPLIIENEKSKKIKKPPVNELTKPVLNADQIAILFDFFKKNRTFINREIDKTTLSEIVQSLSGYSSEPMRQKLSSKDLTEISVNKDDYLKIIESLNKVIKDISSYMSEIHDK